MNNLKAVIEVLGEDNAEKLKESIINIILGQIQSDFENYSLYVLDPEDIQEFIDKCKNEAFNRIKEDIINDMIKKIKENI